MIYSPEECLVEIQNKLGEKCEIFKFDNSIHRFGKKKHAWVIGSSWEFKGNEYGRAMFGSWKSSEKHIWKSWTNVIKSKSFDSKMEEAISKQVAKLKEEKRAKQKEVSERDKKRFDMSHQDPLHPYLESKLIDDNYQAKVMRTSLLVPMYDWNGFNGLQTITETSKKFSTGVKLKGSFCPVKKVDNPSVIYFAEGYSTACSIYMATKEFTICCFNAGNLVPVIESFRQKYSDIPFIVCADNDQWGEKNTGLEYAIKACDKISNCSFVLPEFNRRETKPTDFNDLHVLEGIDVVYNQVTAQNIDTNTKEEIFKKHIESGFSGETERGITYRKVNVLRDYFNHKTNYIVDDNTNEVYVYSDGFYKKFNDLRLRQFAQQYYNPRLSKEHEAREFLNCVKRHSIVNVESEIEKHGNRPLICFKNGVYNYDTDKLLPHDSSYYFFDQIPHNKTNEYECPVWDELLNNLTCGRMYIQNTLEEFLGYCLSGMDYDYNKVLILKGSGANGKTTLINIFESIIGRQNCSNASISMMSTNRFMGSDLQHKLMNISEEEPPQKVFSDTSFLKQLTGKSPIRAEHKGLNSFNMVNRAKLIMSYNEMPFLSDFSEGMRRRLLIVPFDLDLIRQPEKMISNLHEKIKKETGAIINRAIDGLFRLQFQGDFTIIPETKTEINEMIKQSDSVRSWWSESIVITNDIEDRVTTHEMYEAYRNDVGITRISKVGFVRKKNDIIKEIQHPKENDAYSNLKYGSMRVNGFNEVKRCFSGLKLIL